MRVTTGVVAAALAAALAFLGMGGAAHALADDGSPSGLPHCCVG